MMRAGVRACVHYCARRGTRNITCAAWIWTLDAAASHWALDAAAGCQPPVSSHGLPSRWALDAGHWTLAAPGRWTLDTLNAGHWALGRWARLTGHWPLGAWPLVAGALGRWALGVCIATGSLGANALALIAWSAGRWPLVAGRWALSLGAGAGAGRAATGHCWAGHGH
jgi:hypothetical protein